MVPVIIFWWLSEVSPETEVFFLGGGWEWFQKRWTKETKYYLLSFENFKLFLLNKSIPYTLILNPSVLHTYVQTKVKTILFKLFNKIFHFKTVHIFSLQMCLWQDIWSYDRIFFLRRCGSIVLQDITPDMQASGCGQLSQSSVPEQPANQMCRTSEPIKCGKPASQSDVPDQPANQMCQTRSQ